MFYHAIIILLAAFTYSCGNSQETQNVSSQQFKELLNTQDGILLDVRTQGEYSRGHIANSTLISTNDPKFVNKVQLLQRNKPIFIYCLTGSRSRAVANYLSRNGFEKVYNLQRGIMEWQRLGYPISQSSTPLASNDKTYSNSEFNTLINSKNLVLVDFHAPWCAPCKKLAPIIKKAQLEYAQHATIEKINIEANNDLKSAYNIESIPGLVLFKSSKEIWRHTGVISYEELSAVLERYR